VVGASGGSGFFLLIVIVFGVIWFMMIRPQKRRQLEAARMLNSINVGDEVLTAGGIYGEVTELQDEAVMLRIAPELEVRVARKAIGAVVPKEDPAAGESEPEPDPEPDASTVGSPNPENDG
jgi:preprotein translocase, YajC subunit